MPNEQVCDPQRIDDYLEERLSDALIIEFERHLCDCERCRVELQKRSAEPDVWRDAVALLGTDSTQFTPSVRNSMSKELNDPISGEPSADESRSALRERYVLSVLDSLAPTDDPDMLGRVGDYEISGVVGVGGMGAVLKGFDKSLRRVVAIKVMAPHLAHSGSARTRFQREARAAAAITHDNVIDIYAVSEAAGLPYLVMPYARGPSLQKRIDEGGPLGVVEVVRIGRQIAAGLAAAHDQGLVHRDIKPANILLSDGIERLWITDFGVARAIDDASMTQTGLIAGTPQYMSPEQARGETVDHRSDLFSLGSVLYTACTGRPPFRSEAAYGILRRITDSDPRPIREINADIPEWLCLIITRLLAKHPADRFETAGEVVELLDGCLAHLQQPLQVELPPSLRCKPTKDDNRAPLADDINPSETKPSPVAQQVSQTHPFQPPRRYFPKRGMIMTGSIFLTALLGFLAMQWTNPTDISGHWTGENWQHVSLSSVEEASDWYSGTFVDSAGRRGALRLEWSRLQRRYNGRWKVGDAEAGQITLRVDKDGALRGALSVDPESQLESDTARLLEFAWRPASKEAEQNFASQTAATTSKERIPDRQAINLAVSVQSPTKGVIVKLAEELKLQSRFKKGDFIAEIEKLDPAFVEEREKQMAAIKRKLDAVESKIYTVRNELEAAKSICTAVEAQVKTQETLRQRTLEGIREGLEPSSAELQVQGNLDTAVVALKKAEADVIKMETALKLAFDEHGDLSNEIDDLDIKFQNLSRLRIVAPTDGTVTYLAQFDGEALKEGDVICELTPDLEEPSALPKKSDDSVVAPVPTTSPAVTTTVTEPRMNSSLQSLSAFGPASGLAKRMRESQLRLARISDNIDEGHLALQRIRQDLLELKAKQHEDLEDSRKAFLESRIAQMELIEKAKEQELSNLTADKAHVEAERDEARHEQQTILQILHVQLSAAERQFKLQEESRKQTEDLFANGLVSKEERSKVEQSAAVAESELRQLEVLLEYYSRIGRN